MPKQFQNVSTAQHLNLYPLIFNGNSYRGLTRMGNKIVMRKVLRIQKTLYYDFVLVLLMNFLQWNFLS